MKRGDELARRWLEGMKANDLAVLGSHTDVRNAVGSGEFHLGLVNHYYVELEKREGSPVEAVFTDQEQGGFGAVVNAASGGVLEGAPHPENAKQAARPPAQPRGPAASSPGATSSTRWCRASRHPGLKPLVEIKGTGIPLHELGPKLDSHARDARRGRAGGVMPAGARVGTPSPSPAGPSRCWPRCRWPTCSSAPPARAADTLGPAGRPADPDPAAQHASGWRSSCAPRRSAVGGGAGLADRAHRPAGAPRAGRRCARCRSRSRPTSGAVIYADLLGPRGVLQGCAGAARAWSGCRRIFGFAGRRVRPRRCSPTRTCSCSPSAGLAGLNPHYDEAARALGAGALRTALTVARLILPALAGGDAAGRALRAVGLRRGLAHALRHLHDGHLHRARRPLRPAGGRGALLERAGRCSRSPCSSAGCGCAAAAATRRPAPASRGARCGRSARGAGRRWRGRGGCSRSRSACRSRGWSPGRVRHARRPGRGASCAGWAWNSLIGVRPWSAALAVVAGAAGGGC